jgi:hypothetical protein
MRKTIALAMLLVAFAAMPAFASVQNVKVGGSIDSTYLFRDNFDLGNNIVADRQQSLFVTQAKLRVDADLTDQVATTIQLINERAWDQTTDATSDIDLNLAFVTLREMLYSPLTVVVGRQVFSYGNSFIMDAQGVNNVGPGDSNITAAAQDLTRQKALDAIRLIFDYDPLSLELLYSKVDANTLTGNPDDIGDDVDLYGVNTSYELGDEMNTQVEAYFFAKVDNAHKTGAGIAASNGHPKADTIYLPGLRVSTKPIEGLNVQGEVAWQKGNKRLTSTVGSASLNQQRDALAAQVISNYQVPVLDEYKPVLQYVYTYVSGDSNPDDIDSTEDGRSSEANRWTAWDPFFENQGRGRIYNALFDLTNSQIHTVSLQANPIEDVTAKVEWNGIWLDKKINNLAPTSSTFTVRQPDNTTFTADVTRDESIGHEIDCDLTYDYTEDVQLGASFGWFIPGDVFVAANDSVASQAIVHGNVNF